MEHQPPPFFKRGPSAGLRIAVLSLLSVILMGLDHYFAYLSVVRQATSAIIYPLQRIATSPVILLGRVGDFFTVQTDLQRQNASLREKMVQQTVLLQRHYTLETENTYLRHLLQLRNTANIRAIAAEILYGSNNPFHRRVTLDRGGQHGIETGNPVMDDVGLVGQVTRVTPFLSEVTLLTDKDQSVPVSILRNNLRAVTVGADNQLLELRFVPVTADIVVGDTLVTSGLDKVYPHGLPVARVISVDKSATNAFARVLCKPVAGVERQRQLLILAPGQITAPSLPTPPPPAEKAAPTASHGDKAS